MLFCRLGFPDGFLEDVSPTFGFLRFRSKFFGILPVERCFRKRLLTDADDLRGLGRASGVGRTRSFTLKLLALSLKALELMIRTSLPRAGFNEGFRPGNVELQFLKGF